MRPDPREVMVPIFPAWVRWSREQSANARETRALLARLVAQRALVGPLKLAELEPSRMFAWRSHLVCACYCDAGMLYASEASIGPADVLAAVFLADTHGVLVGGTGRSRFLELGGRRGRLWRSRLQSARTMVGPDTHHLRRCPVCHILVAGARTCPAKVCQGAPHAGRQDRRDGRREGRADRVLEARLDRG